MDAVISWFNQNLGTLGQFGGLWLAVGLVSLILTIIALPLIVLRLPSDYFVTEKRLSLAHDSRHPVVAWTAAAFKNLAGLALIVIGAVMLFFPGQGVLTMLIGVLLTNFPGKFRLEQKFVRNEKVLRTLNRVRRRGGRDPLLPPEAESGHG